MPRRLLLTVLLGLCVGFGSAEASEPTPMKRATRSSLDITLPKVDLVRDDGKTVSLEAEVGDGAPVVLTFIFTRCGTICPVLSRTFAQLQTQLGARARVHLVSISLDPEFDTPTRLAEYAQRYGAGRQWHFYTGTVEATLAAQRAFEAARGDKMSHTPVTFLRAGAGRQWVRVDGFATADELATVLRQLVVAR